jgi:hypothetical protein
LIIFDVDFCSSGSLKLNQVLTTKTHVSTINNDRRVVGEIESRGVIIVRVAAPGDLLVFKS